MVLGATLDLGPGAVAVALALVAAAQAVWLARVAKVDRRRATRVLRAQPPPTGAPHPSAGRRGAK